MTDEAPDALPEFFKDTVRELLIGVSALRFGDDSALRQIARDAATEPEAAAHVIVWLAGLLIWPYSDSDWQALLTHHNARLGL